MSALLRSTVFLLAVFSALLAPLRAYTVEEMKAIETKVKAVIAKNTPTVVSLIGETSPGAGSGTVISADGLILTAAHVTQGNNYMIVVFPDGKHSRCKVLGANYRRDVSLAKIEQPGNYAFAPMGDSDKLQATTVVLAMGHPGGYDLRRSPPVRIGRISSTNLGGYLVSDCTLISGDSGGPLFDLEGNVVGIHSSISTSLTFNRDAPVNAARKDWDRLLAGERWGRLGGVSGGPPAREDTRAVLGGGLAPNSKDGVPITEVYANSPLEAAGLKAGDVILKLDGDSVRTTEALLARLNECGAGDKVKIVYRRDGTEQTVDVTLVSRTEMNKRLGIEERPRRRRGGGSSAPIPPPPSSNNRP